MDLTHFPFPQGIRLAEPRDNQAILDFYSRSALEGRSLRLRSDRSPDFFEFLRYQSDKSDVLLYEDSNQLISGIGTICYRRAYVGGKPTDVGYLGDFRVAFSRSAIRVWRKFYGDFLKYLSLPMLTAVIDDNRAATNALIDRKNKEFSYEPLTSYKMVNLLLRLPLRRLKITGVSIRRAQSSDLKELETFLDNQGQKHAFGYCFSEGELGRRISSWPDFKLTDFYLAIDSSQIVGCLAPWSPARAKKNILEKMPLQYQLYRPFIRFPKLGEAIVPIYLTHVEIKDTLEQSERARIFKLLVDSVEWPEKAHMISFCDFAHNQFAGQLSNYVLNQVPMKLFTVAATGHQPLILSSEMREPGFEISLV